MFSLPVEQRKQLRTIDSLERFQQEVQRRTRVARTCSNWATCLRRTARLAMEQSEDCLTDHRCLSIQVSQGESIALQSNTLISITAMAISNQTYVWDENPF